MEACAAVSILVGGNLHDPLLKRLHGIPGETIKHDSAACFRRIAHELLQALLRHRQRCENDELRRTLVAGLKHFGGGQHLVEIYRPAWRSPQHSLILPDVTVPPFGRFARIVPTFITPAPPPSADRPPERGSV